jgi:chemotaxis protein CheZ
MDVIPQEMVNDQGQDLLISRIGHLTRLLRDSMHELGLDKTIEEAAQAIPDARDRLRYVAQMTEQAANSVLAATEDAQPLQEELISRSEELSRKVNARLQQDQGDELIAQIGTFLGDVPVKAGQTNQLLTEIMMAQGFQDLTGQVIMKMMDLVSIIEKELVQVLLESIPPSRREETESLLNGPQVNRSRPDIVSSQDQVDDLLNSLGF